jgi:hypothetical protein
MQNKRIVIGCWAAVAAAGGYMLFGPAPRSGDSEAEIEKTVQTYVSAFVRGDDRTACDQLTSGARDAVAGVSARIGAKGCEQAFRRTRELGGDEVVRAARRIKVHKVRVNGATGTVELRAGSQDSVAQVEQVGDAWKISSLPKG